MQRAMAGAAACAALVALGGRPARLPAQGFEGVINSHMTTQSGGVDVVYTIKGGKSRWETTGPAGKGVPASAMIYDAESGTMMTVIPAQKMYMVSNLREMAKDMPESEHAKFPKMTKTGKQETIASYSCEHWLMGDDQKTDVCLAKGLGFWGMGGASGRSGLMAAFPSIDRAKLEAEIARHPEVKELVDGGAFPLKLQQVGKQDFSMVVTKIERKKVSDDAFRPPAGYQEMNMGKMMQQMQQQRQRPEPPSQ